MLDGRKFGIALARKAHGQIGNDRRRPEGHHDIENLLFTSRVDGDELVSSGRRRLLNQHLTIRRV
ncbi:MAG: hypothetical protein EBT17_03880 [Actinobacteria bacterium]|nr:hypothetical protein [Actinomycetota bacterium]NBT21247.1 hypothetical protein [Actinomycetota bacterium]NBY57196.1 hypothetical protein [Actinomycetota bacterium]